MVLTGSGDKELVQVPVRNRPRRVREGVEGGEDKGEEALRDEGNAEGENYSEAQCEFRYERKEISLSA